MLNLRHVIGAVVALASATASAQSPNTSEAFRPGANHHIGDDAFVAKYHREPTLGDEKLRMHEHFLAAKSLLSSRPATKPELEARRKQILSAFDEYIAKGTTPKNGHLPWRTPVFIDDEHTICAVGYLIERTVGREVAERVAATHRYSYLEEIAAAMPEVAKWVETSGFTLEELSTIQPGYMGPSVGYMVGFNVKADKIPDGDYVSTDKDAYGTPREQQGLTRGKFAKGKMEGTWTVSDGEGHIVGKGDLVHGAGTWHSSYPDGKPFAVGKFANNQPTGDWKIFHADGVLAAEGPLSHGSRNGNWKFYYDNAAKQTLISEGAFRKGWISGKWKHFDDRGKLLATTYGDSEGWGEYGDMFMLDIVPGADKIHHRVHEGDMGGDHRRLDELETANGEERLFIQYHNQMMVDGMGHQLVRGKEGWTSEECGWDAPTKKAARANKLSRLHALIQHIEDETCGGTPVAVDAKRGERLDAMLASFKAVRAQSPDFIRKLALGDATPADAEVPADADEHMQEAANENKANAEDFTKTLAATMLWYVEFPHVDGLLSRAFGTIAGEHASGGN